MSDQSNNLFTVKISGDTIELQKALSGAEKDLGKAADAAKKGSVGFKDLANSLSVLNINFGGIGVNIGAMASQFNSVARTVKTATMATKGFSAALAATGIGLIVVALGTLVGAFASTQAGSDKLGRAMAYLKGFVGGLVNVFQQVSTTIYNAFQDPKQAVLDLWATVKQYFIDRFMAGVDAVKDAIKLLVLSFRGAFAGIKLAAASIPGLGSLLGLDDKEDIKKDLKDIGNEMVTAAKSMGDNIANASGYKSIIEGTVSVFKQLNAEGQKGAAINQKVFDIEVQIRKAKIQQAEQQGKLNRLISEGQRISQDTNASTEERTAALQQARDAAAQLAQINKNVVGLEVRRLQLMQSINDTSDEELLQLAQKKAELDEISASLEDQNRRFDRMGRSIKEIGVNIEEVADDKIPEMAEQFIELSQAAMLAANAVGMAVGQAFDSLFDKDKGFQDFIEGVGQGLKSIIRQLAEAAAKALVFQAILSATGIGGFGGAAGFGQIFSQTMGGGGFRLQGDSLVNSTNRTGATLNR